MIYIKRNRRAYVLYKVHAHVHAHVHVHVHVVAQNRRTLVEFKSCRHGQARDRLYT